VTIEKAAMPGTKNCAAPNSALKITRNINGKTKVKNAAAGFLQNALFWNRTCLRVNAIVLIRQAPRGDP
jgi:hypothetical protein